MENSYSYFDGSDSDASSEDSFSQVKLKDLYALPKLNSDVGSNEPTEAKKRRIGERERQPTRRPDPNVYNRNALLARENRRKKKVHLETLETALEECKRVNTALLEALKKQRKETRRLEREKLYYKNIVANRTEIASLVSALNGSLRDNNSNITPQRTVSLSSPAHGSLYSYSSSSNYEHDYPALSFDYSDNGSVAAEKINSFADLNDISFFDNFLTEVERTGAIEETWNELLHDKNFGLSEDPIDNNQYGYNQQTSDNDNTKKEEITNIKKEHSYVTEVTGVCLHINGGKVSLEFCPTCHWNANLTPPQQLLQEEATP